MYGSRRKQTATATATAAQRKALPFFRPFICLSPFSELPFGGPPVGVVHVAVLPPVQISAVVGVQLGDGHVIGVNAVHVHDVLAVLLQSAVCRCRSSRRSVLLIVTMFLGSKLLLLFRLSVYLVQQ